MENKPPKTPHSGHRERLRRRYISEGIDNFEEHEVLELFLQTSITRKDTKPTAKEMISLFGGIEGVFSSEISQLAKVNGVGNATLRLFEVFEKLNEYKSGFIYPDISEDYGSYAVKLTEKDTKAGFYAAVLSGDGMLISTRRIFEGDISEVSAYIHEIADFVISNRGCGVLFFHKRTSKNYLRIYSEDIRIMAELEKMLEVFDITLKDYVAVCGNEYVCMKNQR